MKFAKDKIFGKFHTEKIHLFGLAELYSITEYRGKEGCMHAASGMKLFFRMDKEIWFSRMDKEISIKEKLHSNYHWNV